MGLLNSYGDGNKVTEVALKKTYSFEAHFFALGDALYSAYKVRRLCTKQYRYTGMTETAAKTCQAAKIQKYTRSSAAWALDFENNTVVVKPHNYSMLVASVEAVHLYGCAWETRIQVHEDESVWTLSYPSNPAALFDETRDYDE